MHSKNQKLITDMDTITDIDTIIDIDTDTERDGNYPFFSRMRAVEMPLINFLNLYLYYQNQRFAQIKISKCKISQTLEQMPQ